MVKLVTKFNDFNDLKISKIAFFNDLNYFEIG